MSLEEAKELDVQFQTFKKNFEIPTLKSLGVVDEKADDDSETIYLCGNSLGPLPKDTRKALEIELNAWGARGVESHFNHPYINDGYTSWVDIDLPLLPLISPIVGAHINEVAVMGSLTSNLNAMLMSFYKPRGSKTKILFEKNAFPSDYYAFLNMVKLFGYDESHIIQLSPRANEFCLRTEDILKAISIHHEELALVCFPGIQYYTGQLFDIKTITAYAKRYDLTVGWDLAHAVGNVVLKLHEWNVDFAVWCSYKYLNSGPGGIAGIYVHEKYTKDNSKKNFQPRLAGWWGNNSEIRFKMIEEFDPINSALSYRQSNPSVLDCVALRSSLEIFKKKGGIESLREHSIKLTNFLEKILTTSKYSIDDPNDTKSLGFKIITPRNEEERGCQLSLLFQPHSEDQDKNTMERVLRYIHSLGIICDERRPDVIRLAPIPLFNTFEETFVAAHRLIEVLDKIDKST